MPDHLPDHPSDEVPDERADDGHDADPLTDKLRGATGSCWGLLGGALTWCTAGPERSEHRSEREEPPSPRHHYRLIDLAALERAVGARSRVRDTVGVSPSRRQASRSDRGIA